MSCGQSWQRSEKHEAPSSYPQIDQTRSECVSMSDSSACTAPLPDSGLVPMGGLALLARPSEPSPRWTDSRVRARSQGSSRSV